MIVPRCRGSRATLLLLGCAGRRPRARKIVSHHRGSRRVHCDLISSCEPLSRAWCEIGSQLSARWTRIPPSFGCGSRRFRPRARSLAPSASCRLRRRGLGDERTYPHGREHVRSERGAFRPGRKRAPDSSRRDRSPRPDRGRVRDDPARRASVHVAARVRRVRADPADRVEACEHRLAIHQVLHGDERVRAPRATASPDAPSRAVPGRRHNRPLRKRCRDGGSART